MYSSLSRCCITLLGVNDNLILSQLIITLHHSLHQRVDLLDLCAVRIISLCAVLRQLLHPGGVAQQRGNSGGAARVVHGDDHRNRIEQAQELSQYCKSSLSRLPSLSSCPLFTLVVQQNETRNASDCICLGCFLSSHCYP